MNHLLEDALDDLISDKKEKNSGAKKPPKERLTDEATKVTGGGGGLEETNWHDAGEGVGRSGVGGSGMGVDEEEMNKFFEKMSEQLKAELPNIDPEEARAKMNESVPQIFDLMQNLLSKELLYPALKDLSPKFDEWLMKNGSTLSKSDKRRFRKQRDIINEIIEVFDDESMEPQHSFEKNLELMEKMQSLGSPPEELTVPEGFGRCPVM